jgi:hypothetical protein
MRRAEAVFVLQGTAGWEAFLLKKPLVVFESDPYYSHSRLVFKFKDITETQALVADALRNGSSIYDHKEDEWYWFIDCVLRSSLPGSFFRYEFPYYSEDNLELVADGLAKRLKSLSVARGVSS